MRNRNSVISVTIIVIIAKLIAFLKEFVLSYYFGVSAITDAYNIAYTIPITIVSFVVIGINTAYIPTFNKVKNEKTEDEAIVFSNTIITIVFWMSCITFLVIEVFAEAIVGCFATGFDVETMNMAAKLTRYMAAVVFFLGYNRVISSFIQLKNKYYIVTLCEILLYGFSIIGIVTGYYLRIELLSVGVLLGYMVESFVLTIVAIKHNYKYSFKLVPKNPHIKGFVLLVIPVVFSSFASDINKIVGKTIASMYAEGSISTLGYANKIDEAVISIFVTSLVSIAYPKLSNAVSTKREDRLQKQIQNDAIYMFLLTIPIFMGILLFSEEIINLLFVRGAFTKEDGVRVALVFVIYSCGMIPTSFRKYYVRIYYAFSKAKEAANNSLLIVLMNIPLSFMLSRFFGLYGIPISGVICIIVGAGILVWRTGKFCKISYKPILSALWRIVLSAGIATGTAKVIYIMCNHLLQENILLILCILLSCIVYFALIFVFRLNYMFKHIMSKE